MSTQQPSGHGSRHRDFWELPFVRLPSGIGIQHRRINRFLVRPDWVKVWLAGESDPVTLIGADATAMVRLLFARSYHPRLEPAAQRCCQRPAAAEAVTADDDGDDDVWDEEDRVWADALDEAVRDTVWADSPDD